MSLSPFVLLKLECMGKPFWPAQVEGNFFNSQKPLDHLICSGWPCRHACHNRVQMPENSTDAVSLFSSFCAVCLEWRQTALGKGEVRCICVCRVCWLAFQIMKCSREQRAGGPYSLCCSFIFTPVSLWFFHTLFLVCVCVYVCMRGCCVYQCPPPPPVSILHGRSP